MAQSIKPPYSPFVDADGTFLQSGSIYIGVANANPETSPLAVYWDSVLTIQASQPLKTLNGVTVRNGIAANAYVLGDFSMTVKNKHGEIISAILSFATSGIIQAYAAAGANADITSLNALTTPLSPSQGGTQYFSCGVLAGTNTLVATVVTPVAGFALASGVRVTATVSVDNTGPSTLNVNSTGDVGIVVAGDVGLTALVGNELQLGATADFEYNGLNWVLLNPYLVNMNLAFKGNNTHAGNETYSGKIITSAGPLGEPGGRLTITSGAPVIIADTTGQLTVYYSPYKHNMIFLYNGTGWETRFFTELSQLLSDITKSPAATLASTAYDTFVWDDAGVLRATRGPAWSISIGATAARGAGAGTTELIRQNGVWVNKNAITNGPAALRGVHVGSFITNAANQVDWVANPAAASGGGNARLGVWNMYNRVNVQAISIDNAAAYSYGAGIFRAANNNNNNRITVLVGLVEDSAAFSGFAALNYNGSSASNTYLGIGVNVTNASTSPFQRYGRYSGDNNITPYSIGYNARVGLGSTFFQLVESCDNSGNTTLNANSNQNIQMQFRM